MIDVGSAASAAVQNGLTTGAEAVPAPRPDAPGADEVARFESAMAGGQPPGGAEQVQVSGPPQQVEGPTAVEHGGVEATSPGDAILRGLGRMSQDFDSAMHQARQAVGSVGPGEMMNTADLMRVQMSMMQVSVQQDVVGKVVGKATQNLDSFLKNQ